MRNLNRNLTGLSFGLLVVKGPGDPRGKGGRRWVVQCSCGSPVKQVREESLVHGRTKSCGCAAQRIRQAKLEKRISLVGQKFGRLRVLCRAGSRKYGDREGSINALWQCRCDCGNLYTTLSRSLKAGKAQSCGCLLKELWLPEGQASRNVVLKRYKRDAERENRSWELSDSRFDELVAGNCHYCGTVPNHVAYTKNCNGGFVCNGIDRLNSSLGYKEGNVVSCCYPCNLMKRTLSPDAFIAHIRKILNHWDNKNVMKAKV